MFKPIISFLTLKIIQLLVYFQTNYWFIFKASIGLIFKGIIGLFLLL